MREGRCLVCWVVLQLTLTIRPAVPPDRLRITTLTSPESCIESPQLSNREPVSLLGESAAHFPDQNQGHWGFPSGNFTRRRMEENYNQTQHQQP